MRTNEHAKDTVERPPGWYPHVPAAPSSTGYLRLDPSRRSLGEDEQPPEATAWENDYGERGYGGPKPPVGDDAHRYFFRLFALEAPLDLAPGTDLDEVRDALDARRLATGTLVGLFAR